MLTCPCGQWNSYPLVTCFNVRDVGMGEENPQSSLQVTIQVHHMRKSNIFKTEALPQLRFKMKRIFMSMTRQNYFRDQKLLPYAYGQVLILLAGIESSIYHMLNIQARCCWYESGICGPAAAVAVKLLLFVFKIASWVQRTLCAWGDIMTWYFLCFLQAPVTQCLHW